MSASTASKKLLWASLITAVLSVTALVAVLIGSNEHPVGGYGGEDGILGGDFTLQGVNGDVSLQDFRGKAVVIYFGFLNCEEVCLNSMRVLQSALTDLSREHGDQVRGMLISIDPARDSREDLAAFTEQYHQNLIGLTGTQREIDAVTLDYGAYYKITEADRQDPAYFFRHSSRYYIVNTEGELVDAMRHSTTPRELIARVNLLLNSPSAVNADTGQQENS